MSPSPNLLKKYDVPGPRYTSYPTVPYWSEVPTEEQWIEHIAKALSEGQLRGEGAALYLHIPFCETLCTYCGCNTRISRNHNVAAPYLETLIAEWKLYLDRLRGGITLSDLHLGGGTPTFLSPGELDRLVSGMLSKVTLGKDAEFSVEADPRRTTYEHLQTLSRLGFRRLSLGIQDFDPKVQDIVNRTQSEEQVRVVTDSARELGFTSINYDLIYGLPLQTMDSVENTVRTVMRLKPDRIAFYGYAHVPWIKPGQRRFTEEDLPSGDEKRALYELGRKMLEQVGYREIGMDHFALETDSLWKASQAGTLHRNFMGYIDRRVTPLFGLGVSAIGDSWTGFAQNEKLLETYQTRVHKGELPIHRGHLLSQEDLILRQHVLNLMTRMRTDWSSEGMFTPFLKNISDRLEEFVTDGLLAMDAREIRVTQQGRAFLRNICMAFDARLARQAPQTQLFSRTV